MITTAERIHDFCYGHRVFGHESKCAHAHGHNGRITFTVAGDLDNVGRVLDFSDIGKRLCNWIEETWDHKFIVYQEDPWREVLSKLDSTVWWAPFNPTAENFAKYLVEVVGPQQLFGTGATLVKVKFEETRKCSAEFSLITPTIENIPLLLLELTKKKIAKAF